MLHFTSWRMTCLFVACKGTLVQPVNVLPYFPQPRHQNAAKILETEYFRDIGNVDVTFCWNKWTVKTPRHNGTFHRVKCYELGYTLLTISSNQFSYNRHNFHQLDSLRATTVVGGGEKGRVDRAGMIAPAPPTPAQDRWSPQTTSWIASDFSPHPELDNSYSSVLLLVLCLAHSSFSLFFNEQYLLALDSFVFAVIC